MRQKNPTFNTISQHKKYNKLGSCGRPYTIYFFMCLSNEQTQTNLCNLNFLLTFEGAPGLPFFKNEYSILHHIDENTYKAIDCSAEQACHVEWYKDGVLFPFGWSAMQQQAMGVSMGSDNQTLILKKAEMTTKGNYTCIVSNQHGTIERHLELKVQGEGITCRNQMP